MTRKFCKRVPHKFISKLDRNRRHIAAALAAAGYTVTPARVGGQYVAHTIQPRTFDN